MIAIFLYLGIKLLGAYPDLIPTGIHIDGDKVTVGVKNAGDFIARDILVYIEAETSNERDNPIGQSSITIASLKVNESKKVTVNLNNFSWQRPFNKSNTKSIKVIVDPKKTIIEKSRHVPNAEANNVITKYLNQN